MNYRIHVKELKDKSEVSIPDGYSIRCLSKANSFNDTQMWFKCLREVFPKRFTVPTDLWIYFISFDYFKPENVFLVIDDTTGGVVGVSGYQVLKNFDIPSATLLYTGVLKEYRQKGLLKAMWNIINNQLIEQGYKKLFCIPRDEDYLSEIYQKLGFKVMDEEYTNKYTRYIQEDLKVEDIQSEIVSLVEHSFLDRLNEKSIVLDLGAYVGEFIDTIIDKYDCRVYAIEADEQSCRGLVEKYKENKKIDVINALINGNDDLATFYPKRSGETSGSIFRNHPSVYGIGLHKVATSLCFLIDLLHVTHIDLLKMDIEGAEISVIRSSSKAFSICDQVSIEFHDFCNIGITEADVEECISIMKAMGFEFKNCSREGKPHYFDCLFYREQKKKEEKPKQRSC